MTSIISPTTDFDIRLKSIHDECYILLNQDIVNFINDRSKSNYDILKNKLFNYLNKVNNQEIKSLFIGIYDYNQTSIIYTHENASNTYEDIINNTKYSTKYVVINDFQYLSLLKSSIYGYHGGNKFCHVQQTNIDMYVEPHELNSIKYFLSIECLSKDNNRILNQISYPLPDIYPTIDYRLKAIHDEIDETLSFSINSFIEKRDENSYNEMRDIIINYLNKIIKNETPITEAFKIVGKEINSPRIIISDSNYSIIMDTYETSHNSFNNYLTNRIQKSDFTHRTDIGHLYSLLYGQYGGTKYDYISQKDTIFYVQSHGTNLSNPTYYIEVDCLADENNIIVNTLSKLELVTDIPNIDIRLVMILDEFYNEINNLIDNFIDNMTDQNYDSLKKSIFEYLINIINCSTSITKSLKTEGKQINSPRIVITDCDYATIIDTYEQCNNTMINYLNYTMYNDTPIHMLPPIILRTAFYGYNGGIRFSQIIQKDIYFYIKSYSSIQSQAKYYIDISCLKEEN